MGLTDARAGFLTTELVSIKVDVHGVAAGADAAADDVDGKVIAMAHG